jgi:hypothetical protein
VHGRKSREQQSIRHCRTYAAYQHGVLMPEASPEDETCGKRLIDRLPAAIVRKPPWYQRIAAALIPAPSLVAGQSTLVCIRLKG